MKEDRLGLEGINYQGCSMKIVDYIDCHNIIVEFQDEYKAKVSSAYHLFQSGTIKNPYHPEVFKVGMIGLKYPSRVNGEKTKEYNAWIQMLRRCYDDKFNLRERCATYNNVTCCNEWLNFENFYEWLHNQDNFDKWLNNKGWAIDKDILIKGNKLYSPDTCCLVPDYINKLFTKSDAQRGNLPIGVIAKDDSFYIS